MKNKRIVILQPAYIPWLGYFEQLDMADVFIFLDHVQYTKRCWYNRNYITDKQGNKILLTIPLQNIHRNTSIEFTELNEEHNDWICRHLKTVKHNYCKTRYFDEVYSLFEKELNNNYKYLGELTISIIERISEYLGYNTQLYKSSDFEFNNKKEYLMLEICRKFSADVLLTGESGKDLYDYDFFISNGIKVEYQKYKHPVYQQQHKNFVPYLSVIDLLFNYGKKSRDIIRTVVSY
ncbi:WbqC family protein [Candidatus Dependentiae bacterium]|nr:WbqC family protein [Candidatus Dependentiae bacterium]